MTGFIDFGVVEKECKTLNINKWLIKPIHDLTDSHYNINFYIEWCKELPEPTSKDAKYFINIKKQILDDIKWEKDKNGKLMQFEVTVTCSEDVNLTVEGSVPVIQQPNIPQLPEFAFRIYGKYPLRMLHWTLHNNWITKEDGSDKKIRIKPPHKNFWTSKRKAKLAYHVKEINKSMLIKDLTMAFFKECNIELKGKYIGHVGSRVGYQRTLLMGG